MDSPWSQKESDTTERLSLSLLEKEMTTLSSNLAWRISWTEEPGRLQSIGLKRVRHDWATITHVWIWELNHKESWARKKLCFKLCCWRRLLKVFFFFLKYSWTTRRTSQSILKKISPEYSLEGLMMMPKFQKFGHLMWRTGWLKKQENFRKKNLFLLYWLCPNLSLCESQ